MNLQQWIDKIFGGKFTEGMKTEVTAIIAGLVNLVSFLAGEFFGVTLSEGLLGGLNTVFLTLIVLFFGARVKRQEPPKVVGEIGDDIPPV